MNIYYRDIPGKTAFIVVSFSHYDNLAAAVSQAYQQIADQLRQNSLQIVHERIFGSPELQNEIEQIRCQVLQQQGLPTANAISYLSGTPVWGSGIAGINIQAVATAGTTSDITPVYHNGQPIGAKWHWAGDDYLILQNMRGNGSESPAAQTETAITLAQQILQNNNMHFQNVIRTWFYLDKVLDWYDDFNRVRNALYSRYGLMPTAEQQKLLLPASTGIACSNCDNSALNLNLLAVKPTANSKLTITQLSSRGQQDAFCYGSAFSRGATVTLDNYSWLQLSGTAAIDESGATLYRDDIVGQINCTLDKISLLLHQIDSTPADICAATVFIKQPKDIKLFEKIMRQRGLDDFPAIYVAADVCRDDLLFEIDAEGIILNG